MLTLPTEIIGRILSLTVPSSGFQSFDQRSADLRRFALICSVWRQEAQRLLFQHPVFYAEFEGDERVLKGLESLKAVENRLAVKHLNFSGDGGAEGFRLPSFLTECRLAETLRALTLDSVTVDPDLLTALPSLAALALHRPSFLPSSHTDIRSLPNLTDLSLDWVTVGLPSCLLPPHLPSLRRFAHQGETIPSGEVGFDKQYSYDILIGIYSQLEIFSCDLGSDLYWCENNEAERCAIVDWTLFDLATDLIEASPIIKHLRITYEERWNEDTEDSLFGGFWPMEALEEMLQPEKLPKLKTLIIPTRWKESPLHEILVQAVTERKVTLLYEDDTCLGQGESLISDSFREHRRHAMVAPK